MSAVYTHYIAPPPPDSPTGDPIDVMVDGVADAPGIGHLIYLAGQPYVVETVTRHVSPGQGAGGQTRLAINVTLRYPHRANEGVHIASIGGNP